MTNEAPITKHALEQMVYHAVMEFAPWPMAEVEGTAHVVQAVNPSFCALLEKTEAELLGRPIAELFIEGHATQGLLDRVQLTGEAATHVETARNTPGPIYWSYTCWPVQAKDERHVGLMIQVTETSKGDQQTKDMNEALLISSVQQHELTDVAERLNVRLANEIAERKQAESALHESEARFRAMADNIPPLAWMANADGHIFWYNRRWYDYTGTTLEQMQGWGWKSLQDPVQLPKVLERWHASISSGEPFDMVFPLKGKDGQFRPFLTRIAPVKDEKGEVVRWFGTNTDISDQAQMADQLRQNAADMAEADRRKSEFLATLAHELRNPLAPLRNGLDLLTMVTDDRATWDQAHGMMTRQVEQMVRLIDDLMDLSRITRGAIDLRLEEVDLSTILEQAIETSLPLVERQGHTLVRQMCADPLIVKGDGMRLAQVFSNLLNNAAKYTDHGGVITVRADVNMNEARVTVQDNGIGIAEDQLAKVFDMFAQVERSNDRVQGGLGIGLNIVKHLVGMHGGRINVHSEGLGKGSSFTVAIPLAEMTGTESAPISTQVPPAPIGRHRILVVDDNEDAANMMAMLLGRWGHEVQIANNGQQAIEIGALIRPRLVFMDLGMPVMDGHTACHQMKRTPWGRAAHIVALTGLGQAEDLRRSADAGFDDHLVKPVGSAALKAVIAALGGQGGGSS